MLNWSRSRYATKLLLVARLIFLPLAALAWLAILPAPAFTQIVIPAEALADENALTELLEQGHALESQRRWGEALAHYEEAVRDFPDRRDLLDRLTRSRIHYDLARRYEEANYRTWVTRLTEREALDLYAEVLRKIQTHYVTQPNWQQLAQHGVDNLTIALSEPTFREGNALRVPDAQINAFADELSRRMSVTTVRNQVDARDVAVNVARLASERLALRPAATALEFTCGATCALDPYSCFLTGDQLDETFSQIEGNFVGLGIELKAQDRSLLVVSVIPGGPAAEAGVHSGDRIVEVDGTATTTVSTDEAADLLKGKDGSLVNLTVVDERGVQRPLRLVRRVVDVPSVDGVKIVDPQHGIAYLRLTSFQKNTSRDFDEALWRLHREGMRSLIIDVRGNPGGLLTAAVDVADKFVPSGILVSTRGRDSHEDYDYQAHAPGTWNVPLIVLIDGDTASASEILAGALRDHRRATVVGQRSYGKGSVQGIFSLTTAKAGVRLTTAKFYSPSGQPIAQRGISPDLAVRTAKKPIADGGQAAGSADDPVLNAALQFARNGLLSQHRP